jgi:hypothetical protein
VEIDYVQAFLAMALAHRDAADPIPRKPRAEAQRRRGGRGLGEGAPNTELDVQTITTPSSSGKKVRT